MGRQNGGRTSEVLALQRSFLWSQEVLRSVWVDTACDFRKASHVNSNLRTLSTFLLLSTKTYDIPLFSCCGNNKSLFGLVARSDPVCGNVL